MRPSSGASSPCWCRTQCGGHHLDPARPERKIRGPPRGAHQGFGHRGAAALSNRYIADRFLPDKAIDLIDECASKLRIEIDSMPVEIDEIQRKITPGGNRTQGPEKGDPTRPLQERLANAGGRALEAMRSQMPA
jgi:hypothetical protein